jgi:hypothetical protein
MEKWPPFLPQVVRISSAEWLPPIFTLKLSAGRGATNASVPRAIKKTTALRMQALPDVGSLAR